MRVDSGLSWDCRSLSLKVVATFHVIHFTENGRPGQRWLGALNEHADLPKLAHEGAEAILDLGGLQSINSIGVNKWIEWMRRCPPFTIRACPTFLLKQFLSVARMLDPRAKIETFYLPFYCEPCDLERALLFDRKALEEWLSRPVPALELLRAQACAKKPCGLTADLHSTRISQLSDLLRAGGDR